VRTLTLSKNTAKLRPSIELAHVGFALQRKCTCVGSEASSLTGGCEECKQKRLQKKFAIGASNDPLEQEADRVADQVMAMSPNSAANDVPPRIQRFSVQASAEIDNSPPSVDRVLSSSGSALNPGLQQDMQQRFGYDFSNVRVHTDTIAAQSARNVNAIAYTVGDHIVFGEGHFNPISNAGRRLLAHELTHVVQQNQNSNSVMQRKLDKISHSGCNFTFELGIGLFGPRATSALATSWQAAINSHWSTDLVCASNGNRCPVTMKSTVAAHPTANWPWQVPESNPVYVEPKGYRDISAPLYKHWAEDSSDLTVTHETGHLMGLLDIYIGKYSLIPNDIMANYYVDPGPTDYNRGLATILFDNKLGCSCCFGPSVAASNNKTNTP
jgi:hypothetical protein